MQIHGRPISLDYCLPVNVVDDVVYCPPIYAAAAAAFSSTARIKYPSPIYSSYKPIPRNLVPPFQALAGSSSKGDSGESLNDNSDIESEPPPPTEDDEDDAADGNIEVEIEKLSRSRRRIRSKVAVDASLETIWGILTDYERLADFIPGLAVSQVLDKNINFARLLQIGEQKLAFGLVFNAKGIVDCYEKDLESLPCGQRRDIEFKMIEGDFSLFEGRWSIEQLTHEQRFDQRYHTTLSYAVDVEPKMWLPVQLVEGRLCKEIKMNLFSIREVAQKASI